MKKKCVWFLLSIPALVVCTRYFIDSISYGQAIHQTGQWSVGLLLVTLSTTPLRKVLKPGSWLLRILRYRRAFGVASFSFAALHTIFYLERKWGADLIINEGVELELATGWLAMMIFVVLAITSNDVSVRVLQSMWKRIHRSVYFATLLTFLHWVLATFDATAAYVSAGIFLAIQILRLKRNGKSADNRHA